MNKKKYLEMRAALMGEAQALIDAGSIEEANAKMEEVKALDAQWEAIAEAQANMNALSDNQPVLDISNLTGTVVLDSTSMRVGATADMSGMAATTAQLSQTPEDALKSDAYLTAWAKTMQHKPLTDAEASVFNMVNEYTHSTENTGVVIPTTVTQKIWSEIEDMYPYYNDITKTYVNGNLTLIRATATTDAAWYDEATATEDVKETIEDYTLTGCELSRAISVTWKLKEMAMEDFLPYIQHRLAERMGAALGYGATNGAGKPGTDDTFKPEPLGICTALVADGTQVVEYTEGALTYTDITKARGLIKSGYANGLKIYANSETIWNVLANVVDENGRPIFINDQTAGGVYRVLGTVVVEDASLSDGQILFSNASRGYQMNINKQMSIMTEEHVKARVTDYCAYAIVDGAPLTYKAHALLTVATAGE
ncbi:MAG: phage major capsid protein [Clostridiales bacterium]|nr:phage major capsid protein [Clostridiales bacterium]